MIVREYCESARPVSSVYLGEKYDFGICPASIRIEMQTLTDLGFLEQPHTSAGRVPTDKGYRFFVNNLEEKKQTSGAIDFDLDASADWRMDNDFEEVFRAMQDLAKSVAAASESLVVGYMAGEGVLWKEGWEAVLRQPEFAEKGLMDNFLNYLNYLESNMEAMKPAEDFGLFIGNENPYPAARDFSVFSLAFEPMEKEEVIFSIVGPKRMAYEKNIALTNEVLKLFNEI